jgi:mono/diheme cytochrome c family protein
VFQPVLRVVCLVVSLALGFVASACGDPVADAAVAALGSEAPGVPPGPEHRPGQPCVVCHGASGVARPAFSLAGTIYRMKGEAAVLADAEVVITDGSGRSHTARSNCAGNFYVQPSEFSPVAPTWVTVKFAGQSIQMESPIFREGSCAACHGERLGPQSAGAVFLTDEPQVAAQLPGTTCRK